MDDILIPFHRQYLQQVSASNVRYPPPKHLIIPYIQDQIHRYFFDQTYDEHLPPPEYQRRVLKRIVSDIERELMNGQYDADEYYISDSLMSDMGDLSALPQLSEFEAAQNARTLSYFLPTNAAKISGTDLAHEIPRAERILIHEAPNLLAAGSNVGLRTWEACLYLAYYLCTCLSNSTANEGIIAGSNVIELGSGTGLLSLICALSLGAKHVVSTDGLPHVVESIKKNIQLNENFNKMVDRESPIVSSVLDWTEPSNLDEVLQIDNVALNYQYILGADITYHPELFDPLVTVIRMLKDKFPKARVLIGATVRNEATLKQFIHTCENGHGLSVRNITDAEWKCPDFTNQTGLFHEQAFPMIIMELDTKG